MLFWHSDAFRQTRRKVHENVERWAMRGEVYHAARQERLESPLPFPHPAHVGRADALIAVEKSRASS